MRIGRILFGILTAIGAGAVLGVLFAPDKGSITRNKLSKKTNELGNELESKINAVTDSVNKKMADLKEDAKRMAAELQKKADHHTSDISTAEKAKMN